MKDSKPVFYSNSLHRIEDGTQEEDDFLYTTLGKAIKAIEENIREYHPDFTPPPLADVYACVRTRDYVHYHEDSEYLWVISKKVVVE